MLAPRLKAGALAYLWDKVCVGGYKQHWALGCCGGNCVQPDEQFVQSTPNIVPEFRMQGIQPEEDANDAVTVANSQVRDCSDSG